MDLPPPGQHPHIYPFAAAVLPPKLNPCKDVLLRHGYAKDGLKCGCGVQGSGCSSCRPEELCTSPYLGCLETPLLPHPLLPGFRGNFEGSARIKRLHSAVGRTPT